MSSIQSSVWNALETEQPSGDRVHCKLAIPDVTDRLHCGFDADGNRHLLVVLRQNDDALDDPHSRGLKAATRELISRDGEAGRYIDLVCGDPRAHSFFDLLGASLAIELRTAAHAPTEIVRRELVRWRRFWSEPPNILLSREEQLGLFAELWFLANWLSPRLGAATAVLRWRGPFAARHDFEWPGKGVESKATASIRGRIHRIHGLGQLVPADDGQLFLFSLRLRETASSANTLPLLVAHCRNLIGDQLESLDSFENALARLGYSPAHEVTYSKLTLAIVDELLFPVDDHLPRLTSAHVNSSFLTAIERVDYDVNLSGFEHRAIRGEQALADAIA